MGRPCPDVRSTTTQEAPGTSSLTSGIGDSPGKGLVRRGAGCWLPCMRLTLHRGVSLAVLASARTEAEHPEDLGCGSGPRGVGFSELRVR
jgi:hypothetical protein